MTDSKISQMSVLLPGMSNPSSTTESSKKTDAVFDALLSQTAGKGYEQQCSWTQQVGKNSDTQEDNQTVYEKEAVQSNFKDNGFIKKTGTEITDKLPEDAKEQIEAVAEEVKDVLKDKLNVSEEELIQAMEQLGMNMLDLADPSKVMQLTMELTGSQDGSELLLIPDFAEMMTEIKELFAQLAEGLNLTPEEMQQLSAQLQKMQQTQMPDSEAVKQPQTENIPVNQDGQTETEIANSAVVTETQGTENQKAELQKGEALKVEVQDAGKAAEESEESEAEEKVLTDQTKVLAEDAKDGQNGEAAEENYKQKANVPETNVKPQSSIKGSQQTPVSFQTTTQTINNGQTVEVVQTTVPQPQIDVENILRQISQMTRITITQAQSSMEMQLNPENLGKVYLQVISKEGAITAQIAAQNEAVKEVLENQIAVLKENMNQQGMKVEAIEVTVASHEFERNLEERQDNPAKEQQEAEKHAKRSINLNSLDDLEGLMSEEEVLTAKIMRDNGNSVDLTA